MLAESELSHRAAQESLPLRDAFAVLFFVSVGMPGLDGRKTLEAIKSNAGLRKIPVVILTTSDDERDIEGCYALGANTYVQKPVDLDGLFAAIQRLKEYWFEIAILPLED